MKKKGKYIILICVSLIFAFFGGYYTNYRISEKELSKVDIIRKIMEEEWYYAVDDDNFNATLEDKIILGMVDLEKDPFTRYLTSLGVLADTYKGIGVSISLYGEYVIISEVSSTSAIEAGLKVGDIILEINGNSIRNKSLEEINGLIKDLDKVTLKIKRGENEQTIVANSISYSPLSVYTNEYNNKVSYVRISEFNDDTAKTLETYFNNLDSKYTELLLDLRGNPGGYIESVRNVMDLFVRKDKVVMSTVDKKGRTTLVKTTKDKCYLFSKIVVLIDGNTASGAEALAAALNYHLGDVTTLYGSKTYGKGSAQKTYAFKDGTYFHYTYALWNTPEGKTINHLGVNSEVEHLNTGISSISMPSKELELYDYGEDVLKLQKVLNVLGYYNEALHSFMDENVVSSLESFQSDYDLTISGKLDNQTLRYLLKLSYDDKVAFLQNEIDLVLGELL